jgi:hypothetical protein
VGVVHPEIGDAKQQGGASQEQSKEEESKEDGVGWVTNFWHGADSELSGADLSAMVPFDCTAWRTAVSLEPAGIDYDITPRVLQRGGQSSP